jgi:hypothetical protein
LPFAAEQMKLVQVELKKKVEFFSLLYCWLVKTKKALNYTN